MKQYSSLSIKIEPQLYHLLQKIAKRYNVSVSAIINNLVQDYCSVHSLEVLPNSRFRDMCSSSLDVLFLSDDAKRAPSTGKNDNFTQLNENDDFIENILNMNDSE